MTYAKKTKTSGVEILIVEDSVTQAEQLKHTLEKNGLLVSVAHHAKEALVLMGNRRPTIVITDILMPDMDGYELCQQIKADANLRDTPVILLTSLSEPKDVIRGLESGADNFIMKPYKESYLISRVNYLLLNKELRSGHTVDMGIEILFDGQKYFINSERRQILDLLLSTYEGAIQKSGELELANRELRKMRRELQTLNEHLEEQVAERTKQLEHLNRVVRAIRNVNQLITKENDRSRLIQRTCENLVATRGFNSSWIVLLDERGEPSVYGEAGLGESFFKLREGFNGSDFPLCARKALAEAGVVIVKDARVECPSCPLAHLDNDQATLCTKLQHQGKIYGILTASMNSIYALDQEEQELFREVAEDIAFALHKMEAEVGRQHAEARFRRLAANASDLIYRYEFMPRRGFTYLNPAAATITGYTPEEFYADPDLRYKIVHPDDRSLFKSASEGELPPGRLLTLRWVRKDNTLVWLELRRVPIYDEEGNLVAVEGIARDISERKQAEEALQRSEKHFRALIEDGSDIISEFDTQGIIQYLSPSIERTLGYRQKEMIGRNVFDFIHPDDVARVRDSFFRGVANPGNVYSLDLRFRHIDGSWRVLDAVGKFVVNPQGVTGVIVNSRDITERRKADEQVTVLQDQLRQSQKMEAIGQLAGGIAHDFNNALTVILGNAQMALMDVSKDNPLYKVIEEIKKAGERASNLTRQLLAFSRKQILQPEVLNLNEIVMGVEKMLRRIIGEDIQLATDLAPDLSRVEADPGQIEQVIVNLAVNSRDAMPEGGKLTIETRDVELDEKYGRAHADVTPGFYVMLAVSDTGIGMTKEVQSRIFEPFFTTKENGKGTGLGLSTVYGIIKQSKGNIWVYSEPGKGTTFKIYLPWVEKTAPMRKNSMREVQIPHGSETVLAVEDEEMVRNIVLKSLTKYGYKVLAAPDGEEALRICKRHEGPIHLILTDVVMPGISGKEIARQAKELRPDLKVLFMSGYTDNAIVNNGILEEGIAFIQKPFTHEGLAWKVRGVLDE
jgi:two-component system, cell cycle sensor histidine kinase and response regulator CckA